MSLGIFLLPISRDEFKAMNFENKCKVIDAYELSNNTLFQHVAQLSLDNIALRNENIFLKNKNEELTKQIDNLHILLKQYDELKKINEELVNKINELEHHIKKH